MFIIQCTQCSRKMGLSTTSCENIVCNWCLELRYYLIWSLTEDENAAKIAREKEDYYQELELGKVYSDYKEGFHLIRAILGDDTLELVLKTESNEN